MNGKSNMEYLRTKYRRLESKAHFEYGVQTLIQKPISNILLVLLIILFGITWQNRGVWLIRGILANEVIAKTLSLFLIVADAMVLYIVVLCIGALRARKTEALISSAFKPQDIRYGAPILKSCRRKGKNVLIYELYTVNVALSVWQERQENIAQVLDIHFVSPYIQYGGKNQSSSKTVLLYTAKGQEKRRKEPLYDEL